MAKAAKRADGRLQSGFRYEGKRYTVYAKTQAELIEKVHAKKEELRKGTLDHDNPTLDLFYERWTENRAGSVKESTLRCQKFQYESCAAVKVNGKPLGSYRLTEIKPDDIRQVQKALQESGQNTTQTINDKIAVLSHIFHDALLERYIDFNPVTPVKPLKRTEPRARDTIHRALTLEEQAAFFEESAGRFYDGVLRMAILTGMRIGEIGALYPSDIRGGVIHVQRTITKNEIGGYVIGEDTKTFHGIRKIPMNDQIREVIKYQMEVNRILDGGKEIGMFEPIFKAPERGLLMATPVDREIARICKRRGIEKITAHALRATFATRCIEQGMAPRTLQELLGHADFSLTMNLYGHVVDNTLEAAMNKISIMA